MHTEIDPYLCKIVRLNNGVILSNAKDL